MKYTLTKPSIQTGVSKNKIQSRLQAGVTDTTHIFKE